ncbi:pyridine nucleotide-disulfide oxidoreductase/dicluster-binding protein [Desulfovibrio inopinatus]|uniref:pyridine nucleotide-disulfide oxidoreductase/dicluster-binding protein n=1 Tax=Desulfovibrio inopinatus TaxID=102109 RepID=UPI000413604B|nr:pyridine nucleotide-disulfide oxidoreductase/dicluster-binding protein [Desulfovibrio inopinatus]
MEQQVLRTFEGRCIQDEPAYCKAACPLHIDVRPFMAHMEAGQLDAARKVLAKTMPLPDILGRICDQPCRKECKRQEVGDPVNIGDVERACVTLSEPNDRFLRRPPKDKRIAVLGAGLSSMTMAWDISTKAYPVTMYCLENERGGFLLEFDDKFLPKDVIENGFASLEKRGVVIEVVSSFDRALLDTLLPEYSAVYAGCDTPSLVDAATLFGIEADENGAPVFDSVSMATSIPKFFLGGFFKDVASYSPVTAAFHGRKAGLSVERLMQGASLTASREKEGPCSTRLFTSIEDVEPLEAVPFDQNVGLTAEQAAQEAKRCLQCECLECVKVCAYLEHYKGYPKKYAREIYNNLSVVYGQRKANLMIDSCSFCDLCKEVCPSGFSMAEYCYLSRCEMTATDRMPASAHDYVLREFEYNASDAFFLAKHEPGTDASAYVFMPGCQLSASSPDHVLSVYEHLRSQKDVLPGGVGLLLSCCGTPAYWAGRPDLTEKHAELLKKALGELGNPTIIAACPSCLTELAKLLPDARTVSLWEILDKTMTESMPSTLPAGHPSELMLHDPCSTRHAPAIQEAARRIFARLQLDITEPELTGAYTECCGYGGLMDSAHPAMASKVVDRRVGQSELPFLAYCAMCRDSLSRNGKNVFYALDYIFPESAASESITSTYPLMRATPGMADRQETRARLKNTCLETIWGASPMTEALDAMTLELSQEVQDLIDSRRILASDIKRVIQFAESNNKQVMNPDTGVHIASHSPAAVTYWLEYKPLGDNKYAILRAWSHRMRLVTKNYDA